MPNYNDIAKINGKDTRVYVENFEIRRDYDGLNRFCLVKTVSNPNCKGFEPFPSNTVFTNGDELLDILMWNLPNRGIRKFWCKPQDLHGGQIITIHMYLTKMINGEKQSVEEIANVFVPYDVRKSIKDFDFWVLGNYYDEDKPPYYHFSFLKRHLDRIQTNTKHQIEVQEMIHRVLEKYCYDKEIDLEGLVSSEEFKYILLSDPKHYKSIINFDNKYLGEKFDRITTASLLSLYISIISGSCLFENNSDQAKAILSIIAAIPVIGNIALAIRRRVEVNKLFENALENENKSGARKRTHQA